MTGARSCGDMIVALPPAPRRSLPSRMRRAGFEPANERLLAETRSTSVVLDLGNIRSDIGGIRGRREFVRDTGHGFATCAIIIVTTPRRRRLADARSLLEAGAFAFHDETVLARGDSARSRRCWWAAAAVPGATGVPLERARRSRPSSSRPSSQRRTSSCGLRPPRRSSSPWSRRSVKASTIRGACATPFARST